MSSNSSLCSSNISKLLISLLITSILSKVVITWSRLTVIKFCLVLPGSRQCYKLFMNYALRLHVKSFIPTWWDPSFVLSESCFAGTKFSHVIVSARLRGMKKLINTSVLKISTGVHFNRSKILLLCFYNLNDFNLWKKNLAYVFVEFHHFTEATTGGVL